MRLAWVEGEVGISTRQRAVLHVLQRQCLVAQNQQQRCCRRGVNFACCVTNNDIGAYLKLGITAICRSGHSNQLARLVGEPQ